MSQEETNEFIKEKNTPDDKNHKCWGCSSFIMDPYVNQFYCSHGYMLIAADEPIHQNPICGKIGDNKHSKLTGTTTILLRLMAVHRRILIASLPKDLIGCVGNLLRYNIAKMGNNIEVYVTHNSKIKMTSERVLEYNDR
jgi:hypothetical protein